MNRFVQILYLYALVSSSCFAATTIEVLSAVVKDQKIEAADVILQKNGASSVTTTTDADGKANLNASFSDNDDGVVLIIKKAGYSHLVAKCPCQGFTYALSPVMVKKLDGLRVVLNWGAKPEDIDSHIVYPGSHVYFSNKTGNNSNLDVDDVNGFGPETITVSKKTFGQSYLYAVHDYSDNAIPNTTELSSSNAKVFVYIGESLIKTYYVPKNKVGNLWLVFAIDGNGEFHDINEFKQVKGANDWHPSLVAVLDNHQWNSVAQQSSSISASNASASANAASTTARTSNTPSAASTTGMAAGTTSSTNNPDTVAITPLEPVEPAKREEARRVNHQGEDAFHAKDLDKALQLFLQAIDLDPNYGQAYSNLGLTYQQSNRIAEALWANRKAIALASGNAANVTRASSYYNIARIYEAAEQFDDALQQYQLALNERHVKVYEDAIARMQQKLHP